MVNGTGTTASKYKTVFKHLAFSKTKASSKKIRFKIHQNNRLWLFCGRTKEPKPVLQKIAYSKNSGENVMTSVLPAPSDGSGY